MRFGKIVGVSKPVSRLLQGTAGIEPDLMMQCLDLAFERGINSFDTAFGYGAKSEGAFGKWVNDRGVRDKVVVIAKGAHHSSERNRVTPEDIESDMMTSMERMGIDYFDAYVLHRDDPEYPVGPIVECLNAHSEAGRIGAFGGSNWSHQRIAEANKYAADHGQKPFAITSPNLSLAVQIQPPWGGCVSISGDAGKEARDYYIAHKDTLSVVTWSSLAGGFFSGRFTPETLEEMSKTEAYFDKLVVTSYCGNENFERLRRANEVAADRGSSLAQVALSYVVNQPMNIFALMLCRSAEEFDQNIGAIDLELTEPEIRYLELKSDSL